MKIFLQRVILMVLLSAMSCLMASGADKTPLDTILPRLDDVIERRDTYYIKHEYRIDSLKNLLHDIHLSDSKNLSRTYHDIYSAYSSFQGDSALKYARLGLDEARKTGEADAILRANIDVLFTHMSGGNFTEANDLAEAMDLTGVSDRIKAEFYYTCIRLYSDLSNFSGPGFSDKYARMSGAYCDSVMAIAPENSYFYRYALAFSPVKKLPFKQKIEIFEGLLKRSDLPNGTKAMLASILADFYGQDGNSNMAEYNKARSAILDISSAKRETVSLLDLSRIMFERDDIDRASRYINVAKEDAEFYNARNRKFQIMSVLPLIERARYASVENRRHMLSISTVVMALMVVLLIISVYLVFRQLTTVRNGRRLTEEQNEQIRRKNQELSDMLARLEESNKIKDEYIGYGFQIHAEYIRKIESLYNMVDRKLSTRQYDELRMALKHSDIRKEKENMHKAFDQTFLRLFPDFISQYKALFPADDAKNAESDGSTLTSEMRIFALIRLGITDVSNIALLLNYSVNTVNTYKTKAKNRSLVANGEFEEAILKIKSA